MSTRLEQVLRAGEAHAQAQEKRNWFNELPPEINEKILDKLPESAFQTCELVRNLCASGALSCDRREHLLGLLRRIFFHPRDQKSSTNNGVESTLRLHFGDEAVATPNALKALVNQLCEAYVAASNAILKMDPWRVPWQADTSFAWPAIRIPETATKWGIGPNDPSRPIHAFIDLRNAADLVVAYHDLVRQQVEAMEWMKDRALRNHGWMKGSLAEAEPGPRYLTCFAKYEALWQAVNSATRSHQLPPGFWDRRFDPLWRRKYELHKLKVEFRADDTVREYKWYAKKRSNVSPALDDVFRIYPERQV